MFIQPVDYLLAVWFVLAGLSSAYVAWDQFRNNPEPVVMKWGFILITLYLGPVGLLLYVLADKEPRPGTHEEFVGPLWKQAIGSTIHCVAGDATGIIVAAAITAILGLPMWLDVIIEYLAGFAFGLFIFQSLFMRKMMGGTYWENVQNSFMPEFTSMNAMMAGMAPVMSILMMGRDMRAMWPGDLLFWGVMSLGIGAGFVTAYGVNVWLVYKGLKHGLMTRRAEGENHGGGHHDKKSKDSKHSGHGMELPPALAPTRPQIAALAFFTSVMLAAGYAYPFLKVNMHLGAHDVGGLIMPPGMIMDFNTPGAAMREMAAIDPGKVSYSAAVTERGAGVLKPKMDGGVKVFDLDISAIDWPILPGVTVQAYAFNRQVPGPTLRLIEGDEIRINVTNHLDEGTTVHWHGMILPNEMDGVPNLTQRPIRPGETFVYQFKVGQSGTYFYHSHDHADRQQSLGLYGALLIEPATPDASLQADHEYTIELQEWLKREWLTFPAMPMEGGLPNFFTINGKAFPATETISMKVGETLKLRFIGSHTNGAHPMHVHGGPFQVVAKDGETLDPAQRYLADTVNVAPGERYDVIWPARRPGKWLLHCHIPHHTSNNNVETEGGGGLMMVIEVGP